MLTVRVRVQVRELQTELIVEQKKSEDYHKGVRRFERRCRELTSQVGQGPPGSVGGAVRAS